jgi:hypothetical protein
MTNKKQPLMIKKDYIHVKCLFRQQAKKNNYVCGDLIIQERNLDATTIILLDGIGSGIKANIAAHLNASRILELLKLGFTITQVVMKLAESMHKARTIDIPFVAFSLAHILHNGNCTILTYEMPPPVFIENNTAFIPDAKTTAINGEVIRRFHFNLSNDNSVILVSDGVTQSGMGKGLTFGLTAEGVKDFINGSIKSDFDISKLPERILMKSYEASSSQFEDDTTAILLTGEKGKILNILTGPPVDRNQDDELIRNFMNSKGLKVICGSTTLEIASRVLNEKVELASFNSAFFKPPTYTMKGLDLATEGAIVLNQLYNILDKNYQSYDRESCVSEMAILLQAVDLVYFWVGMSDNQGHQDIVFTQLHILPRKVIVPLIIEKLKAMGKLVVVNYF